MVAVPVPFVTDQTPPAVASVNAGVEEPTQTPVAPPPIADTVGFAMMVTLVVVVFEQPPLLNVYVTV